MNHIINYVLAGLAALAVVLVLLGGVMGYLWQVF